jgi:ribose transport system ATP-binding protein
MDEPTSSLQGADVDRLFALIRRLSARGIAVIYISHFLEEVRQIADRYTVLRDGRNVVTGTIADVTNEELIARMVGRTATGLFPSRQRATHTDVARGARSVAPPARRTRELTTAARSSASRTRSGRTELGAKRSLVSRPARERSNARTRRRRRERAPRTARDGAVT